MRGCKTAIVRNKATQKFCHAGNMKFLRSDKAPLRHRNDTLGTTDEIIRRYLRTRIVRNGIRDVVRIGQNARRNGEYIQLSHSSCPLPVQA